MHFFVLYVHSNCLNARQFFVGFISNWNHIYSRWTSTLHTSIHTHTLPILLVYLSTSYVIAIQCNLLNPIFHGSVKWSFFSYIALHDNQDANKSFSTVSHTKSYLLHFKCQSDHWWRFCYCWIINMKKHLFHSTSMNLPLQYSISVFDLFSKSILLNLI